MTDTSNTPAEDSNEPPIDPDEKIAITERIYGPGATPNSKVLLAIPGDVVTAGVIASWADDGASTSAESEAPAEDDEVGDDTPTAEEVAAQEAEALRTDLEERATALNIPFNEQWKTETLEAKVKTAEAAKAAGTS